MSLNFGTIHGSIELDTAKWTKGLVAAFKEADNTAARTKSTMGKAGDDAGREFAGGIARAADQVSKAVAPVHGVAAEWGTEGDRAGGEFAGGVEGKATGIRATLKRLTDGVSSMFGSAGKDAGGEFADGFAGASDRSMSGGISDLVGKLGPLMASGFAAVGVGAGAALFTGLTNGMDQGAATDKLAAGLGLTPDQSKAAGEIAGRVYADAYGDSFEQVTESVGAVASSLASFANPAEIEGLTKKALDFAKTFDVDVNRSVNTAATLMKAGLATNGAEAFDLMVSASQKVPAQLREDVLDAVDEYSQFFAAVGMDGPRAVGLLVKASEDGMYGIDKMGDAVKEFSLLATEIDNPAVRQTLQGLGLDANKMANDLLAGGDDAASAMGAISKALLGIEDPGLRTQASVSLFGTPLEDLGKNGIPGFLAALTDTQSSLGDVAGAADRMGSTLNDNAASRIEAFKRQGLQKLTDFVGDKVLPMLQRVAQSEEFQEFVTKARGAIDRMIAGAELIATEWGPKIVTTITDLWDKAQPIFAAIGAAWEFVANLFDQGADDIGDKSTWLGQTVEKIGGVFSSAFGAVQAVVERVVAIVGGLWERFGDIILDRAEGWIEGLKDTFGGLLDMLTGIFDLIKAVFSGKWGEAWDALKKIAGGAWDAIWGLLQMAWAQISGIFEAIGRTVGAAWNAMWDGIKRAATVAKDWIVGKWNELVTFVGSIPTRIGDALAGLWDGIMWGFAVARQWVSDRWNDLVSDVTSIPGKISSAASGMWDGIKDAFKTAINWVIDAWNGLGFKLPSIDLGPLGKVGGWEVGPKYGDGRLERLKFHSGGTVPGPPGAEVPALLLAGERVRTQPQEAALQAQIAALTAAVSQGGGESFSRPAGDTYVTNKVSVPVTIKGPVAGRDAERWVTDIVASATRKGIMRAGTDGRR